MPHVVVAFDFSRSAEAALERAAALAAQSTGLVLHAICVLDPRSPLPSLPSETGVDAEYAARVEQALAAEVRRVASPEMQFAVHAPIGRDAAAAIVELAREVDAERIVIGSHDLQGLARLLVGSTSAKVARDAGCSVEIARAVGA